VPGRVGLEESRGLCRGALWRDVKVLTGGKGECEDVSREWKGGNVIGRAVGVGRAVGCWGAVFRVWCVVKKMLEERDGCLEAGEVDVACAEEVGAAVPDFVLQRGVVAELMQMVGGKGVRKMSGTQRKGR